MKYKYTVELDAGSARGGSQFRLLTPDPRPNLINIYATGHVTAERRVFPPEDLRVDVEVLHRQEITSQDRVYNAFKFKLSLVYVALTGGPAYHLPSSR